MISAAAPIEQARNGLDPHRYAALLSGMRLIRIGTAAVAAAVIGFLWLIVALPLEVAKDIVIHPIAEEASKRLNLTVPTIETIISSASLAVPFLAAICTLYLYHVIYRATDEGARYALIREHVEILRLARIWSGTKTVIAALVLIVFIGAVLIAGWKENFGPQIPGPLRYTDLHLSSES